MSARNIIKSANLMDLKNEHKVDTIVDDIQRGYESLLDNKEVGEASPESVPEVIPEKKDPPARRRKFADDAVTKFISVQLLESEVKFLEKYGGEFGGKTGYIRRLVQQEMQRVIDQ